MENRFEYLALLVFASVAIIYYYFTMNIGLWRVLARDYPYDADTVGTTYRFVWVGTGLEPYCLTVVVGHDAITLKPLFPFRLFHPPVTIPFSEIHHVTQWRFQFCDSVSFFVKDREITLFGTVAKCPFWKRQWNDSQDPA